MELEYYDLVFVEVAQSLGWAEFSESKIVRAQLGA